MDTKDIKFGNRYNLYLEVGFLKTLQDWRIKEPDLSFLRLFKENITNANLWPSDTISREFVLQYTLVHMQTMFSMQSINYIFEIISFELLLFFWG